jgi:hypothetical protein
MTSTTVSESAPKIVLFSARRMTGTLGFSYMCIISGEEKAPTKAEHAANLLKTGAAVTDAVTRSKELHVLSGKAFSQLVSSMDISKDPAKVAINLLRSCRTDDFPQGDAKKAIEILKNYYNVKSVATAQMLLK